MFYNTHRTFLRRPCHPLLEQLFESPISGKEVMPRLHHNHKHPVRDATATVSKPLAPEDVCAGDIVTVLSTITELPSFMWCADPSTLPADELVRVRHIPKDSGIPLKVTAVCLPFVLVRHPHGKPRIVDVRQSQLARLTQPYASICWRINKRRKRLKSRPKSK